MRHSHLLQLPWAPDPSKAHAERFFILWGPLSIAFLVLGVVATGWYRQLDSTGYTVVSLGMALPCMLGPAWWTCAADRQRRWWDRFYVKANVWNAVFGFVGNYFWTHYFYQLLGARYTFPNWRLNGVPIACYLATQAYFCCYHTFTTLVLRWVHRRHPGNMLLRWTVILLLAYTTALAETATIAGFPHYAFRDRRSMYRIGSAFYGLYFVVSFPMYARIDEADARERKRWTLSAVTLDALAAAMLVTLLLDAWRLTIGAIGATTGAPIPDRPGWMRP
ncbi:hypothetical protein CDCA_CDCA01G0087 [Cyanidium caldarium]|uniref:Cycloeucalenol cycloisomerase n=1 Tax=Cyanidium caldarium TaxID=2771 RepID=A0AAV9IP82_CYACA|nr:hypothetical protein CDCA_CDCA01G0087 [Cyanidium caldarium]